MGTNYNEIIKESFPFPEFRTNQAEIIKDITESLNELSDNFVLESPTGAGKSVISYTVAKALSELNPQLNTNSAKTGPPILILTSTRQLQKQYIESFSHISNFSHIWSAKNYECAEFPLTNKENIDLNVYFGHPMCFGEKKCEKVKINECEYLRQRKLFLNSKVSVTNYAYFMASNSLQPKILICDEGHNLQKILCDKAGLSISIDQLVFFNNQILKNSDGDVNPKFNKLNEELTTLFDDKQIQHSTFQNRDLLDRIKNYISNAHIEFKKTFGQLEIDIFSKKDNKKLRKKIAILNQIKDNLCELCDKYDRFLSSDVQWVYNFNEIKKKNDQTMEVIEVKPLEVYEYFNNLIGNRTNKCLFMSATICGVKQFCRELGIPDFNFKQVGTTIPVENRLVHFVKNLGNLTYKNKHELLPKFIITIDRIIKYLYEKNGGKKVNGIIHTVSYDNANKILEISKYAKDMLIPNKDQLLSLNKTIENGKKNIIVSPSIIEGVDLIDELSRFQIFIKVPYQFLGDVWVKTKLNMNSKWYSRMAIIKIVQGCGRSIRSDNDWAETFILDGNFERLIQCDNELFPEWFKESIRSYDIQL